MLELVHHCHKATVIPADYQYQFFYYLSHDHLKIQLILSQKLHTGGSLSDYKKPDPQFNFSCVVSAHEISDHLHASPEPVLLY